ncbi:MAG: M1 family aminopeptidase, partial [Candidatus Hodarchaeales archaeon]
VETPGWFAGMEYPNIVLIAIGLYSPANEDSLRDVVSHEVAHNWFAYLVGSDSYAEPWLDEAFATYCGSYLYFEFTGRSSLAAANLRFNQQVVIDNVQLGFDYKINQSMAWWDSSAYNSPINPRYSPFIYLKGMTILHMLRQVVGNETFFESIQAYIAEWAYENAHISDFIGIVEETVGYDLEWFFDEWLDDTGVPEYNLIWSQAIIYPSRTILNMTIRQNQQRPFIMPIDIRISIENRTTPYNAVIWINESVQVVTIEMPEEGTPTMVELDPQGWVLRSAGSISSVVAMHTAPTSTSAEASAFDFGALFFLLMVIFPILARFQRKKSP